MGSVTCGTSWHMLANSSGVTLTLCGNMNRQLMMFCRMSTSCGDPLSLVYTNGCRLGGRGKIYSWTDIISDRRLQRSEHGSNCARSSEQQDMLALG